MESSPRIENLKQQLLDTYASWFARLSAFFRNAGLAHHVCEDLAQTTLIKAYDNLHLFEGRSSIETWLYRIAKCQRLNHLRDRLAKKRSALDTVRLDEADQQELAGNAPDPFDRLERKEQLALIKQCIPRLPPQMRTCYRLFYQEKLSYNEIASLLQINPNTVKSHLNQARRHLAECATRLKG